MAKREKRVYIENLGCAKNQSDAEVMLALLEKDGWVKTDEVGKADLVIVNTCAFIESAREESVNAFFMDHSQMKKGASIIVTGCLSQRYATELTQELPEADGIFGNRDLSLINGFVKSVLEKRKEDKTMAAKRPYALISDYPSKDEDILERSELFSYPGSAYLKISEGCNHRCSYCAIPLIRGPLRSIREEKIIAEARRLVSTGIKEINLIAQDLAAYGTDEGGKSRFLDLLEGVCGIEGDFRIRLLYIHPDAFPAELPEFVRKHEKIIPYFDIPFQHSYPGVLGPMGRTGDREKYVALVKSIRETLPEAVIRTTLMLAYPTESKESLEDLERFVKEAEFDWMGMFEYSPEEGTPAFLMTDKKKHSASLKLVKGAKKRIEALQEDITSRRLQKQVGKVRDILIEEIVEGEDMAIGRIYSQAPEVDGCTVINGTGFEPGKVYRCGITRVNGLDLEAVPV